MSLPRPFLGFFPGAVCRLEIPTVQMTKVCLAPELLDSELSVFLQRPRSRPQGDPEQNCSTPHDLLVSTDKKRKRAARGLPSGHIAANSETLAYLKWKFSRFEQA
jgi:hypothetical protein